MHSGFSHVQLFVIPWTVAHQDPLSMGFSWQEYWSALPSAPPGDLPNQGWNLRLLYLLQGRWILYALSHLGSVQFSRSVVSNSCDPMNHSTPGLPVQHQLLMFAQVHVHCISDRDMSSTPGLGRSPGEGYGNPLQYSCQENPMDRGAWRATVHRVTKSGTRLK